MFEAKFQSFTDQSEREASASRVAALRAELATRRLDGFIVPHADDHQNEYLPANAERLAWLTGFTGSAGRAIVLPGRAALFVDGRYTLQARNQTDADVFEVVLISEQTPEAWLEANLPAGARLGYDPWLHTSADVEKLSKASSAVGAELTPAERNPVDAVWTDRPAPPLGAVTLHDSRFAGEDSATKLARIRTEVEQGACRRVNRVRYDCTIAGRSTSGARTSGILRSQSRSQLSQKKAARRSSSTAASSRTRSARCLPISARCASRRTS